MSPPQILILPLGFEQWPHALQVLTLGVLTFVQEDIPTVSAALLASAGNLTWTVAFLGCFFGIWIGDGLLYSFARLAGRPLVLRPWSRKFIDRNAVERSEQWFAQKGIWLLWSSRFIPGTRLPTYLAAGFLKLPFSRFLCVTGLAVLVWTAAIFGLARMAGPSLAAWLPQWRQGGIALLLTGITIVLILKLGRQFSGQRTRQRLWARLGRWTRWEFWPPWLFYTPVVFQYLWLGLRYRGFTLPTAANPGIATGGFVGESKFETLKHLMNTSPEFTAEAWFMKPGDSAERLAALRQLQGDHHLECPFILKPDIGQRGNGVRLIRDAHQAAAYLEHTQAPLVAQRYVPDPMEVGIFYCREPQRRQGRIFAITEKQFPRVTGDGVSTLEELVWRDDRARLIADKYLARLRERAGQIPQSGEVIRLVEAGNHAQGCIFRDGGHLWSQALEDRIDEISRKLTGFHVGRYDIRYASVQDLRAGRNFQIIELNGASSEATSIYDERNSLWRAYKTLFRQWQIIFAIGAENRRRGVRPTGVVQLWRHWRENAALAATYPLAD